MIKKLLRTIYFCYSRRRFARMGLNSYLHPLGIYGRPKSIYIGNHVYIGPRAILSATEGLLVGDGVTIGPEFIVMGGDHNFREVGKRIWEAKSGGINQQIVIEDDVWIGARVTVLKGVKIGEGAVIGAGSVVTKSVSPYMVYAGNPAVPVAPRFTQEDLRRHLRAVKSSYDFDVLADRLFPVRRQR